MHKHIFDDQPLIVSDNTIEGALCGIMCLHNTYPDPPTVKTYSKKIIISNNLIRTTWLQGIDIRGVNGILCLNNTVENAAKLGSGGINYAELRSAVKPPYPRIISDNPIFNVDLGIVIRSAASHVSVVGNQIYKAGTAVVVRYAPYSKIMNNRILDSGIGIQLEDGNLASNYLYLMNMSLTPDNKRKGGTIIVKTNIIEDCTESYKIVGVTLTDLTFLGRCAVWEGDIVDGTVYDPYVFPNAVVPTNNSRTWNIGDKVRNTIISSGTVYEKVCVSPGTYGDPVNTTGDITNGSKSITSVADMACIGPGIYLKINSLVRRVVFVDLTSFTVDKDMPASGLGVLVEDAVPVFANLTITP